MSKINKWWFNRRFKYNMGLIAAGITAFILYAVLGGMLIAPYDAEFEITLFTILFQGAGYLVMMGIANILYYLGPILDSTLNIRDSDTFRFRLFNLGFVFSILIPFIVPIMVIIYYFKEYAP